MVQLKNEAKRNLIRRRALLAIFFAGGMLNSQLLALSENETKSTSTETAIQSIANDKQMTAEEKAFYLLILANDYLSDSNRTAVDAKLIAIANEKNRRSLRNSRGWEFNLVSWADMVSSQGRPSDFESKAKTNAKPTLKQMPDENKVVADAAIQKAVTQLDLVTDKFSKLNLYYVASLLFERVGNADGMQKCKKLLKEAFQACEGGETIDEEQTKAAISILNSMAKAYVLVHIPDLDPKDNPWEKRAIKPFTENDFKESQKLRRRAVAMSDRLVKENHLRRKAHRDLALWYMQLGKNELAENEKQVLFELIGFKDDSVLYPQQGACGHLSWWQKEKLVVYMGCGMG